MQSRHTAIDIAKGLGIVLVVLGHNPTVRNWGWPGWMIFSFHMPLFFMLSGLFLRPSDGLARFAFLRFHSILKPYAVVAVALAMAKLLADGSGTTAPVEAAQRLYGALQGTGATLTWTPMWYLPHLFIASCASLLLLKALAGRPRLVMPLCTTLLAVGVLAIGRVPALPWSVDLLPVTVPFMLGGWHFRERLFAARFPCWAGTAALAIFITLNLAFDARMDLNMRVYGHLLISTVEAVCGIYLVLALAFRLQRLAAVSWAFSRLGSASLFILVFHHPIQLKALTLLQAAGMAELQASALAVAAGTLLPWLLWEAARRLPPLRWLLLPAAQPGARPEISIARANIGIRPTVSK